MNKFGLLEEEDDPVETAAPEGLAEKLARFFPAKPHGIVDVEAADAAAAPYGFISREAVEPVRPQAVEPMRPQIPEPIRLAVPEPMRPLAAGRRRRAIPAEPTRHLAIRLSASGYDRFVAYADRYQLTYHDALYQLLDLAGS